MKKLALMLLAGGMMAMASCTTETHDDMSEAQIDSTVNARVEEIRLEMMRQNDSLINALAWVRADSIIASMKGGKSVTTKTTTTRTTTVKPGPGGAANTTTANPANVTTRPGASNQTGPSVTDRPGANTNKENKSVTDRPGAR